VVSKELCDRFGALLVEMGDICAEVLDECLQSIREEEAAEANGAMERGMIVGDLAKVVGRMPLAKIGARHSKTDQRRLNDAHDLLVDAGADCEASQAEKIRGSMNAQLEAFQKTIRDQAAVITDWTERIKKMESIPLPEGTTRVNVVEKGMDGRGGTPGRTCRAREEGAGPRERGHALPPDEPAPHGAGDAARVGHAAVLTSGGTVDGMPRGRWDKRPGDGRAQRSGDSRSANEPGAHAQRHQPGRPWP